MSRDHSGELPPSIYALASVAVTLIVYILALLLPGDKSVKATRILYRFDSPTIRTSSINELRSLVSQFRLCENSVFHMLQILRKCARSKVVLAQRRFNELKYFFTQNSVLIFALHYPENA
jgi:hypothetical protein